MGEDEERVVVRTAEDDVDGSLRHIDLSNLRAFGVVDKDLPVDDVNIAAIIDGHTFPAAFGKDLEVA